MPQNVVDADTWTATVQCRADGEAVDGAGELLLAQDLADRTRRLYNRSIETVGGDLIVPMVPVALFDLGMAGPARWNWVSIISGANTGWQCNAGGVDEIFFATPTLHNTTFDEVEVTLMGDGGGAGPHVGLPASMPRVSLMSVDLTTGGTAIVGQQIDTSPGIAQYDVLHTITLVVAAQTMSSTNAYYISVRGESGANSINGALEMYGCTIQTVPA